MRGHNSGGRAEFMKSTRVFAIVGALLVAAAVWVPGAGAASGGYTPPPVVPWESALPPLPTAQNPQFQGVPGCQTPTMAWGLVV